MLRLFWFRLKHQWLTLLLLALSLVFINFLFYAGWSILGGERGILFSLFRDSMGILRVVGGEGVTVDNFVPSFFAVGWRHPILLLLFSGYALSRGGRAVAGEIEEETADFLFTLPLPRFLIVLTDFLATAAGMVILTAAMVYSSFTFGRFFGVDIGPGHYLVTGIATFFLYLSFSAIAYFFSNISCRGGSAVTLSVVVVIILYTLDIAAALLQSLEGLKKITLFHQYKVAESLAGSSTLGAESLTYVWVTLIFLALAMVVATVRDL